MAHAIRWRYRLATLSLLLTGGSSVNYEANSNTDFGRLEVVVGDGVGSELPKLMEQHLSPFINRTPPGSVSTTLRVLLGQSPALKAVIPDAELEALKALPPDAFILRSTVSGDTADIACASLTQRGVGYAAFEALQQFGFAFLHPLKGVIPQALPMPLPVLNVTESPRWAFRGTHYHTQHPLELTPLLNGRDGDNGIANRSKWEADLWMWTGVLQWMLAHKQSYFEWMLLSDLARDDSIRGFELGDERKSRLSQLVSMAHAFGLEVGADVPVTLQQQHALCLVPGSTGTWEEDASRLEQRVQWVLSCGFDHLGTELGSTEFTRGLTAEYQIKLLNLTQSILGPRKLLVKNHCSTKQHADNYPDPRPGHEHSTLNFNYLSFYADSHIVAMPHTVQIYSLVDRAPTYGNKDFGDLRSWTQYLLQQNRSVVFYPETAYWVNYDSGVPLFLAPIYAKTRFDDANILDSLAQGKQVLGQLNFESGWQWGYWLGNMAQAAVSWQRFPSLDAVFDRLLQFVEPDVRKDIVTLLVEYADAQHELLIQGKQIPQAPGLGLGSATGIAYIMGSEGLSDLGSYLARVLGEGAPQPDRLLFSDLWTSDMEDWFLSGWRKVRTAPRHTHQARWQWYHDHLQPLLQDMSQRFQKLSDRFDALPSQRGGGEDLLEAIKDLATSAKTLTYRCNQVLALYDHAADCGGKVGDDKQIPQEDWCTLQLQTARQALSGSLALVPDREAHYGMGQRHVQVSSWRPPNPTAYNYGYLWPAHNLFYWQRDQAIVEGRIRDPCFGSINDPVELGLRGGGSSSVHRFRHYLRQIFGRAPYINCLEVQQQEPTPLVDMANQLSSLQMCALYAALVLMLASVAVPCCWLVRRLTTSSARKLSTYAAGASMRNSDLQTARLLDHVTDVLPPPFGCRSGTGSATAQAFNALGSRGSQVVCGMRWRVTKAAMQRRWRRLHQRMFGAATHGL